jgi:hypothetical protein
MAAPFRREPTFTANAGARCPHEDPEGAPVACVARAEARREKCREMRRMTLARELSEKHDGQSR